MQPVSVYHTAAHKCRTILNIIENKNDCHATDLRTSCGCRLSFLVLFYSQSAIYLRRLRSTTNDNIGRQRGRAINAKQAIAKCFEITPQFIFENYKSTKTI